MRNIDVTKLSRDYSKQPWKNGEIPVYDDFYYLYVELNLPAKQIQEYMGIKSANLSRTLRSLNIYKPKSKTLEVRKELNIEKFNSASPFGDTSIYQKGRKTCTQKYGTDKVTQAHIKNKENLNADYWYKNFVQEGTFLREKCMQHHDITLATVTKYKRQFGIWEPNKPFNRGEREICHFLYSLGVKYQTHVRGIIGNLELDFYIPEYNLAIEYDGLLYHSIDGQFSKVSEDDGGKSQSLKTTLCREKGITLLKIFEDEWLDADKKQSWKTRIARAVNKAHVIDVESLVLSEISPDLCDSFLLKYNLASWDMQVDKAYGLFDSNYNLVHVFALTDFDGEHAYVLTKAASKSNVYVENSFQAVSEIYKKVDLFNITLDARTMLPCEEKSLNKIGFVFSAHTAPEMYYFHKHKIRDGRIISLLAPEIIKQELDSYDSSLPEEQILLDQGYYRIYDSGEYVYSPKIEGDRNG